MQIVKNIFFSVLICSFFIFFFYDAFHYKSNIDDTFNAHTLERLSPIPAAQLFLKEINGRWFSHFITAYTFSLLKSNYTAYALYVTFMLLLFLFSIYFLHKKYSFFYNNQAPSSLSSCGFSLMFTSTLYFLLFDGRQEIWAWVSSVNNHLLSVILGVFLISFLLSKNSTRHTIIICVLSLALGGLNEVNAICSALLVSICFFYSKYILLKKTSIKNIIGAFFFISLSLTINVLSGGYASRMNTLPPFALLQALKNTVHSFAFPILQYQLIPVRLVVLFLFLLFLDVRIVFTKKRNPSFLTLGAGLVFICVLSFFMHSYILSDVVPPRGEVWVYALMLFAVFAYVNHQKSTLNIKK
ncbi:MAG: hypothetical protein JST67_09555 [Bacteroidetes bacterium]|nr:hypothetical protein [Bacteroidota bacterium]